MLMCSAPCLCICHSVVRCCFMFVCYRPVFADIHLISYFLLYWLLVADLHESELMPGQS